MLLAGMLLLAVATAAPGFASRETTVGTTRESWYLITPVPGEPPVAGLPGAPAPPVSPYPAGTLHAGVTAGQEDSRSYIALDSGALAGEDIVGGTLTLPVAADGGTRSPEAAELRVCRADSAGDGARGSTAPPPAAECTIGSPARYSAERDVFEVDLGPLVGFLDRGLAIIPSAASTESTWHVAFHASDSEAPDAPSIEAVLFVDDELAAPIVTASPPALESTTFASTIHPESAVSVAAPDVGIGQPTGPSRVSPSTRTPAAPSTATPQAPRTAPIGVTGDGEFRYSVVFALPLLVLVGVPYFGYALTGPVGGQRRRDSRALKSS
jgi:hypothetical protein